MTLICPQCQARLQLDGAKTPSQPFTVRCPKCQHTVKHSPISSATESVTEPPIASFQLERSVAHRFAGPSGATPESSQHPNESASDVGDLAKLLAEALGASRGSASAFRPRNKRNVLVCAPPDYREKAAHLLDQLHYEVFVAENVSQALGTMREEQIDVLVLDANFDPVEQGTAFVMREIKSLRPAQRRRLFLVYVSTSLRTMDLHTAFLHNVNLVFNPNDMDQLPGALETALRNYNDLYRSYFTALGLSAL